MRKGNLEAKILRKLFSIKKLFYQFPKNYKKEKDIAFIIGCQRSGTTMIYNIFTKDLDTKTYGEFSKLSSLDEHKIRLNPLDLVKKEIAKVKPSLVVLKPLVESQNILNLLENFNGSKAIWMYRNYKDVASSNLKKFGIKNGIKDLRYIVKSDPKDWRADKVSKKVREVILKYFSEDMNPYDAAVLFWYARNSIYFELNLDQNPDIIICKYEDLVVHPDKIVKSIYKNLNQDIPNPEIYQDVDSTSLKKGKNIELTPEIVELADDLLKRLDKTYQTNNKIMLSDS